MFWNNTVDSEKLYTHEDMRLIYNAEKTIIGYFFLENSQFVYTYIALNFDKKVSCNSFINNKRVNKFLPKIRETLLAATRKLSYSQHL